MAQATFTLGELAEQLGCELEGDANKVICGVGTLTAAKADQISFLSNRKYVDQLSATKAGVVLLTAEAAQHCAVDKLVCADPYLSYAKASQLFQPKTNITIGIHSTAIVHDSAIVAATASIGPYAVIGEGCRVGEHAVIGPHCVLDSESSVGDNSVLRSHVSIYRNCRIGSDCLIHAGVVVGADGFGIAWAGNGWEKIAQLGAVVIGDNVEVGANTTIDRGAIDNTIIEDGVRLDNQIQIGHNCRVGKNTAMAGQSGLAGSSSIGSNCLVGGQVGIAGHLSITDGVTVMQDNGVLSSITQRGQYSMGFGVQPAAKNRRIAVRVKQLDEMARTIRNLEKRLASLEAGDK